MPVYNTTHIVPEPEDHKDSFGAAVAINQKYLVVGDFLANRVIIYTRHNSGQWTRSKQVVPPKNSIPDQVGWGFGEKVQLEGDYLIVGEDQRRVIRPIEDREEFNSFPLTAVTAIDTS